MSSGGPKSELFRPEVQLGLGLIYQLGILWESTRGSTSDPQDPPEVSSEAFGVGGSEIFGLELMLCGGGSCSFSVAVFCHPFAKGAFSLW